MSLLFFNENYCPHETDMFFVQVDICSSILRYLLKDHTTTRQRSRAGYVFFLQLSATCLTHITFVDFSSQIYLADFFPLNFLYKCTNHTWILLRLYKTHVVAPLNNTLNYLEANAKVQTLNNTGIHKIPYPTVPLHDSTCCRMPLREIKLMLHWTQVA
jgi:hypothetical protein